MRLANYLCATLVAFVLVVVGANGSARAQEIDAGDEAGDLDAAAEDETEADAEAAAPLPPPPDPCNKPPPGCVPKTCADLQATNPTFCGQGDDGCNGKTAACSCPGNGYCHVAANMCLMCQPPPSNPPETGTTLGPAEQFDFSLKSVDANATKYVCLGLSKVHPVLNYILSPDGDIKIGIASNEQESTVTPVGEVCTTENTKLKDGSVKVEICGVNIEGKKTGTVKTRNVYCAECPPDEPQMKCTGLQCSTEKKSSAWTGTVGKDSSCKTYDSNGKCTEKHKGSFSIWEKYVFKCDKLKPLTSNTKTKKYNKCVRARKEFEDFLDVSVKTSWALKAAGSYADKEGEAKPGPGGPNCTPCKDCKTKGWEVGLGLSVGGKIEAGAEVKAVWMTLVKLSFSFELTLGGMLSFGQNEQSGSCGAKKCTQVSITVYASAKLSLSFQLVFVKGSASWDLRGYMQWKFKNCGKGIEGDLFPTFKVTLNGVPIVVAGEIEVPEAVLD